MGGGGMRVCSGGHVWLLQGGAWFFPGGGSVLGFFWGGMHGFCRGCMVFSRGHVWFFPGGHAWFFPGGMHGFSGGVCVFFSTEHAWFFPGGLCVRYDEIRSMSGRYASYWNAFLSKICIHLIQDWDFDRKYHIKWKAFLSQLCSVTCQQLMHRLIVWLLLQQKHTLDNEAWIRDESRTFFCKLNFVLWKCWTHSNERTLYVHIHYQYSSKCFTWKNNIPATADFILTDFIWCKFLNIWYQIKFALDPAFYLLLYGPTIKWKLLSNHCA